MFSFTEISRWLSFPLDPVTIEDWVANREFLGTVENPNELDSELETAYQIEMLRHKKASATKDQDVFVIASGLELSGSQQIKEAIWLLAPVGSMFGKEKKVGEVEISGGLKEKKVLLPREIIVIDLDPGHNYEVRAKFQGNLTIDKKSEAKVALSGYSKLIIDTRGRPITFDDSRVQREKMGKWKNL